MDERRDAERAPPEVDLRVVQANERTLLAWIRTGLALMAFGVVIARVGMMVRGTEPASLASGSSGWIGAFLVAAGTLSNLLAAIRYVRVRRAIVEGRAAVPEHGTVVAFAYGMVLVGAILAVYLLMS